MTFTGCSAVKRTNLKALMTNGGINGVASPETVRLDPEKPVIATTTVSNTSQGSTTA
jgi:hypothetical protein